MELKGFAEPVPAYEVVYRAATLARCCGAAVHRADGGAGAGSGAAGGGRAGRRGSRPAGGRAGDREDADARGGGGAGAPRGRAGALGALLRGRSGAAVGAVRGGARRVSCAGRARSTCAAILGPHAAPLSAPGAGLRARVPDLPEPVAQPDEERVRLLDAVAQILLALATRVPTVLVLDDLHWADPARWRCCAMWRGRAARAAAGLGPIAASRWTEQPPLAETLGTCRGSRATSSSRSRGLKRGGAELLETLADRTCRRHGATTLARGDQRQSVLPPRGAPASGGGGQARARAASGARRIPPWSWAARERAAGDRAASGGCRSAAERLLAWQRGSQGAFRFEIARRVAGLEEARRWTRSTRRWRAAAVRGRPTRAYDFPHALVRQTLLRGAEPGAPGAAAPGDRGGDGGGLRRRGRASMRRRSRALPSQRTLPGAERGVPVASLRPSRPSGRRRSPRS